MTRQRMTVWVNILYTFIHHYEPVTQFTWCNDLF